MALVSPRRGLARNRARGASPGGDSARRARAESEQLAGPRMLTFGFLLGLAFWAIILFALFVGTTFSYEPHGFKWAALDPAYTADASVAGYTEEGMRQWSAVSGLSPRPGGSDIRVVVGTLLPPVTYFGQPAQANVKFSRGQINSCEVRLDPVHFFALPEQARQNTVTHEIGHCIGLNHSELPGLMKNPLFYDFSDDDAAGAVSLYGVPEPDSNQREELAPGWNLVVWGKTVPVASCDCAAVYALRGEDWVKWFRDSPKWLNTLPTLEAGQPYWVLR